MSQGAYNNSYQKMPPDNKSCLSQGEQTRFVRDSNNDYQKKSGGFPNQVGAGGPNTATTCSA